MSIAGEIAEQEYVKYEERIAILVTERDLAREECGHEKAMRKNNGEERDMFIRLKGEADAKLEDVLKREKIWEQKYQKAIGDFVDMADKDMENRYKRSDDRVYAAAYAHGVYDVLTSPQYYELRRLVKEEDDADV